MKETAEYYSKNPKAAARKRAYQRKYNKKPREVAKRVELNKINRRAGTYGNGDNKDVSHQKDGSTKMEAASKNRARRERSRLKGSKRS